MDAEHGEARGFPALLRESELNERAGQRIEEGEGLELRATHPIVEDDGEEGLRGKEGGKEVGSATGRVGFSTKVLRRRLTVSYLLAIQ